MFLWLNEAQLWLCRMGILMQAVVGAFSPPTRCFAMPAWKSRGLNQATRWEPPAKRKTAPRRVSDGDTTPAPGADSNRQTSESDGSIHSWSAVLPSCQGPVMTRLLPRASLIRCDENYLLFPAAGCQPIERRSRSASLSLSRKIGCSSR